MARGKYKRKRERQRQGQIAITDLHFSTRLTNLLTKQGIVTMADLLAQSDVSLLSIQGIGPAMMAEIQSKKEELGLV